MAVGEWTSQFNPVGRWDKYEPIFYINRFIPTLENVQWKRDSAINELFEKRLLGEAAGIAGRYTICTSFRLTPERASPVSYWGFPTYTEFIESGRRLQRAPPEL